MKLGERLRERGQPAEDRVAAPAADQPAQPASATPPATPIAPPAPATPEVKAAHRPTDPLVNIKQRAQQVLFDRLGARLFDSSLTEARLRELVVEHLLRVVEEQQVPLTGEERQRLVSELTNDILGYGPLQLFLDDTSVSEIMVNATDPIFVERRGRLERTASRFLSEEHLRRVIERIVADIGRRVDESSPMVDARLPDGSRVNAIIPPLAVDGPALTIRKFSADPLQVDDLVRLGTLTHEMAELLSLCVRGRRNMLVSGGTGTGKTTLLNVLSSFIPGDERIVTIEDAVELQLRQEHVVRLESRPANMEGRGEVAIRDLVRNALRMRPDRIVVGEARGGEALDMLQAMNTGHDGSLSTVHANSPRDALSRLETMVLMAGMDLPARAIREQVASALDVIVHVTRLRDGSRRITHVSEVTGMEGQVITLQDIFLFDYSPGVDDSGRVLGSIRPTGVRPAFAAHLEELGLPFPATLFGAAPGLVRS